MTNKQQEYKDKSEVHEEVLAMLALSLENGEFKDFTEGQMQA